MATIRPTDAAALITVATAENSADLDPAVRELVDGLDATSWSLLWIATCLLGELAHATGRPRSEVWRQVAARLAQQDTGLPWTPDATPMPEGQATTPAPCVELVDGELPVVVIRLPRRYVAELLATTEAP